MRPHPCVVFQPRRSYANSIVMLKISELLPLVLRSTKNNGNDDLFSLIFFTCLTGWPSSVRASVMSELSVE